MKVEILTKLTAYANAKIEIPVEDWDEIEDWFVVNDFLMYRAKGCTEHVGITLHSRLDDETVDWGDVLAVQIFKQKGKRIDYDNPLEESGIGEALKAVQR